MLFHLFALFSVILSQNEGQANAMPVGCHCDTFATVAAEFCTDENLEPQNWEETCFEVQDYINVGLGLFNQAAECHLDLCSTEDQQFFQHLCADLQSGHLDAACTNAALAGDERRRLKKSGRQGCFDADSKVVLKDG